MKTTSLNKLIRFCAFLFVSLFVNSSLTRAQVVGGGGTQPSNNNLSSNANLNKDDLYSAFFVGILIPEGTFSRPITNPPGTGYVFNNLTLPFKGLDGLGATTGYTFGFSAFDAFSKFQMGANLPARFGLQFGFDFDYMPISCNNVDWSNHDMTVSTDPFFCTGFKIGPQFNINPMENMGIGIYVTVNPSLSIPGGENATYTGSSSNSNGNYTYTGTYDISDSSSIHFNINVSAGINFYYKSLTLGVEYDWVHTKYNGSVKQNETQTYSNGDISSPSATYSFTDVIPTHMLKLSIGIRFGGKSSK